MFRIKEIIIRVLLLYSNEYISFQTLVWLRNLLTHFSCHISMPLHNHMCYKIFSKYFLSIKTCKTKSPGNEFSKSISNQRTSCVPYMFTTQLVSFFIQSKSDSYLLTSIKHISHFSIATNRLISYHKYSEKPFRTCISYETRLFLSKAMFI